MCVQLDSGYLSHLISNGWPDNVGHVECQIAYRPDQMAGQSRREPDLVRPQESGGKERSLERMIVLII